MVGIRVSQSLLNFLAFIKMVEGSLLMSKHLDIKHSDSTNQYAAVSLIVGVKWGDLYCDIIHVN